MKFAVQENLIPGEDLLSKWELVRSIGFDGIELRGQGDFKFRDRLPELRKAHKAGVVTPTVCAIMPYFIGSFERERRRLAIENMKSLLSIIGELGGYGAITPAAYGLHSNRLPPFQPPRSAEEDRQVLLEGLHELGEHAAQEGVTVLLEPLNRYEDHMLNRLRDAAELCETLGLTSVRVMGDLFHMNIEEADLARSIREASRHLAHLHVADSNRLPPGEGHTDFAPSFLALKDLGFEGYLSLECHLNRDPNSALRAALRHLRACLPST